MKNIILILILVAAGFIIGRYMDFIKYYFSKMKFKPNLALMIIVGAVFLFVGILIGKGNGSVKTMIKTAVFKSSGHQGSSFNIFGKKDKVLVLSDFEDAGDLNRWRTKQATIEQSTEHAIEGKYSGKVTFLAGAEEDSLIMKDFFGSNPDFGDWSGFGEIRFNIFNSSGNSGKLILKIKDANGSTWQRSLYPAPGQNTEVKILIEELKDNLNISQIRYFNLFRWKPKKEATFYIDSMRLIPLAGEANSSDPVNTPATAFLFDSQNSDFGLGVSSAAEKVFTEPNKFKGRALDTIEISLAGNEYESSQLAIYAKKPLDNVSLEVGDVVADINGTQVKFDKNNIKLYVVGYVNTKKPGYSVSYVGWWPDPLEEKTSFNIRKDIVQPIWIQVYASSDAAPGEYSGIVTLKFGDGKTKDVKLKIKVWDFVLPKETHLKTSFDFYDNRLRKAYPQRAGESQQDYKSRVQELKNEYYLDMIRHRIMPTGNFDLSNPAVLNDLKVYLENGLSDFSIGKYSGSSGNKWPKEPGELNALIDTYRGYAQSLKEENLLDKAYIYTYDEPKYGDPFVAEVAKMIHTADPALKNMVCLHSLSDPKLFPGWTDDIDIWCVRNVVFNEAVAKLYRDMGKEVWIYVSGPEPPYPALVIDYPAMAYRIVPWMCWKYDVKGYLSWCVNFWEGDPWQNTMNTKWEQNGNGFLYYPGENGPVTSIRLEVTRDGMEDYEYLYLLDKTIKEAKEKNSASPELISKAESLLKVDDSIVSSMSDYTKNTELINKRRKEIAEAIENLSMAVQIKQAPVQTQQSSGQTQQAFDQAVEDFSKPIEAVSGKSFGDNGQLTFELFRNGTFIIDGKSGFAWQKSDSYRDSAFIRSTKPLPKTYKISAVVGEIDYGLDKIEGLRPDTEYQEGPMNENGCYLLVITDEEPTGHHTNDWWHQHRKVAIDIDNNVWGKGKPNPIFLTYSNKNNQMYALSVKENKWTTAWEKAITYEPNAWYRVEIEKTETSFNLYVYDSEGKLLKGGLVPLGYVWHEDGNHPDYFVIGDPHENYYQGSMKIKSISMPVEAKQHE